MSGAIDVVVDPEAGSIDVTVDADTGDIEVVVDAAESETDVYIDSSPPGSVTEDSVSTLTNKTLTDPKISAAIYDTAANELLKFTATASAVNEVTMANAATGNGPTISATGGDTNIDLILSGKGTGAVRLTSPKILTKIVDTNGNELIKLTATASAVNELTLANAATGNGPTISATGDDANIDLNLAGKGTGGVKAGGSLIRTVGKETIWMPVGAMTPRTTNGAAWGSVETTTNKVMIKTLDFDSATVEYAQFGICMPKGWNRGTVTASFKWRHAATTTNFGVAWSLAAVSVGDDDAMDVAFGTAQTATKTGGTTNDFYTTSETSAITIAGSPATQDYVIFQVAREVANGSDTMAIDASLIGVFVHYTTAAATDA